ncbi:MAG: hypothetical protein EON58_17255 [Alphaproteobacteria bacterium]|nr:MAG: hypothetical protein EON58_17255 [Alphaproteobacteria bacterium]
MGDFAEHCDRGTQPLYTEDGRLAVVNSRHILENGLDYDNFERTDAAYWNQPDFVDSQIHRGDKLTYTTGAKIGRTAAYLENAPALASNHVNLVWVSEENPIYVSVVLNSMIGRMQTRRACSGSAQVELYPGDIRNFVVPFVSDKTQEAIAKAVTDAHHARARAKNLLETAKRAVEVAIEQSEAAGLVLLEDALKEE